MHYLTVLIGSLLSMLGIHETPGQTSVTRISGEQSLLSRTTVVNGVSRFQCLQSDTGRCNYLLYREHCSGAADAAGAAGYAGIAAIDCVEPGAVKTVARSVDTGT